MSASFSSVFTQFNFVGDIYKGMLNKYSAKRNWAAS